jgi:ferredoxin/flavodoxin---NADP+ reductase
MKSYEPNAVVTRRIDVAPGLMVLQVAAVGWKPPPFAPGQFAVVGLPASAPRVPLADPEPPQDGADPNRLIRRAYSLASPASPDHDLELYVTLVRSGELTPRLFALEQGSRLWLGPRITGTFTLKDVPDGQHVVMVATGTGLAPYMSMLRTELTAGGPRKWAVLVGARHSWDLGYTSELTMMQKLTPAMNYLPIVSRPKEEVVPWSGAVGHVQSLWTGGAVERALGFKPTPKDTHVFLCGSPGMITEMTELLQAEGFQEHAPRSPGQIHAEKYW